MGASTKDSTPVFLEIDYTGPKGSTSFSQKLTPLPPKYTTEAKTAYLVNLRLSITEMQGKVNQLLTAQMERDNQDTNGGAAAVDNAKEEENYGEEVVDDSL